MFEVVELLIGDVTELMAGKRTDDFLFIIYVHSFMALTLAGVSQSDI